MINHTLQTFSKLPFFNDFMDNHYNKRYMFHNYTGTTNSSHQVNIIDAKSNVIFEMTNHKETLENIFNISLRFKKYAPLFRKLINQEVVYNDNDEEMFETFVEGLLLRDAELGFIKRIERHNTAFDRKTKLFDISANNNSQIEKKLCLEINNGTKTVNCYMHTAFSLWDDKLHAIRIIRIPFEFSRMQVSVGYHPVYLLTDKATALGSLNKTLDILYNNMKATMIYAVADLLSISIRDVEKMSNAELSQNFQTVLMYNY